jgi:hypothetical protein
VIRQVELVPQDDEIIDVDELTHILLDALDEDLLVHPCPLPAIREVVATRRRAPPHMGSFTRPVAFTTAGSATSSGITGGRLERRASPTCCELMDPYAARLRADPGPGMPPPLRNMASPAIATTSRSTR